VEKNSKKWSPLQLGFWGMMRTCLLTVVSIANVRRLDEFFHSKCRFPGNPARWSMPRGAYLPHTNGRVPVSCHGTGEFSDMTKRCRPWRS
jgi:hypothetical protein